MSPSEMPRLAAAGLLRPLPAAIKAPASNFGWADLLPIYQARLLIWDRVPYALPILGESPLCIYRTDLFADGARAAAFEKKHGRKLAPPNTWEDFAELAEFFHDTAAGGPAPSLPPLPAGDAGLDRAFFTIAACYARRAMPEDKTQREEKRADKPDQLFSFQYDHRTGKPRLTTPGFVYALNLMKRLQKCRPVSAVNFSTTNAFQEGHIALALADVSLLSTLQHTPATADKVGVFRMPGGGRWFEYASGEAVPAPEGNAVPYLGNGGWLAAVPLGAPEPDAGFGLITDLAGRERSSQIVIDPQWGGGPIRRDHLDRTRWDAFGLDPARTKDLKDALRQTLLHPLVQNPAVALRTTAATTHQVALLKEVRAFLTTEGGDAAKALAAAAARWEEMDKAREGDAARDDYRISVGLLPLPAK
jgi:multiple sugar transport system substrate-binding protein